MDSAYQKRWQNLAFEMTQRINSEETTVTTLRDQGDANFLVHQGRLLQLRDLQIRMQQLSDNFPEGEEESVPPSNPAISEELMQEIVSRVQQAMGTNRDLGVEHQSFDDLARATANQ
jgi:hypothetical protein